MYVSHPLVRPDTVEARAYQQNIASACLNASTLVVLPTGLGKTIIAVLVIAEVLQKKGGRALLLAPTKPLVEQHARSLENLLTVGPISVFTGEVSPSERPAEWKGAKIVVSTPQVIANDLVSGSIGLEDVSVIIYDEAHRASGNYAYVFIAEKYKGAGLSLGITASPGSTAQKILAVCENLGMRRVEIRREQDPDVKPYVHDIKMHWMVVEVPPDLLRVMKHLKEARKRQVKVLQGFGLLRKGETHSVRELLAAQTAIRQKIAQSSPRPQASLFHAASAGAAAMEINHALEMIETQGTSSLVNYLDRLEEKAGAKGSSRAARMVMADEDVIKARFLAKHLTGEHPKMEKVGKVVGGQLRLHPDSRIIVFTHYRDTSDQVVRALGRISAAKPVRFVGQASRGDDAGLSQKQQAEMIENFKKGVFNVLVATSVGEEGLDIPSTDLVVFYEPVPSEIRTIQRRGRTGRKMPGRVVVLLAKGTRDEAYYWSSRHKEQKMMEELDFLRRQLASKVEVGFPSMRATERYIEDNAAEEMAGPPLDKPSPDIDGEPVDEEDDGPGEGGPVSPGQSPVRDADKEDAGDMEKPEDDGATRTRAPVPDPKEPEKGRETGDSGNGDDDQMMGKSARDNGTAGMLHHASPGRKGQLRLGDFETGTPDDRLTIITDHREFNSEVVRELSRNDIKVVPHQLSVGDYILSDRVGVERKEVRDFIASLMDGRLFHQIKSLKGAYSRPLVVIEGEGLMSAGGVGPDAIYGTLASIVIDFGVPVIFTRDARETALLLKAAARREAGDGRTPGIRGEKMTMSLPERQQFIVEGLPRVSGTLSQRLLAHFGSVDRVLLADAQALAQVKGVGPKTAEELFYTVRAPYLSGPERGSQKTDALENTGAAVERPKRTPGNRRKKEGDS